MAQRPGFDINRLSTADKILLGAGILYLINLFLAWNRTCQFGQCVTASGWSGLGILNGLLVIALLVWVVISMAGMNINLGTMNKDIVSAGLAFALLLFTIIRVLVKASIIGFSLGIYIFSWVGLVLALIIAYGGYMKWQTSKMLAPPATGGSMPPPPGGPVT